MYQTDIDIYKNGISLCVVLVKLGDVAVRSKIKLIYNVTFKIKVNVFSLWTLLNYNFLLFKFSLVRIFRCLIGTLAILSINSMNTRSKGETSEYEPCRVNNLILEALAYVNCSALPRCESDLLSTGTFYC